MTDTHSLDYYLFPHMTLSSNALANLCVFLPRLNILEIIARAQVPEWAQDRVCGYPVLNEGELSSRIGASIEGYRNFAKVHSGPGGMLGYLQQALDEIDEPRYRIQEELRGKLPAEGAEQNQIVQASLFLEMARELDQKELEIESGYDRLNAIEQEFRDILGIEDEESEPVDVNLSSALAPDQNGLLYMLGKRIRSWFRMFSIRPVAGAPVFVAALPGVADEALDAVRTGCEKSGIDFSTAVHTLGPVPWPAGKARTLPQSSELVSACRRGLDDFIRSAARIKDPEKLEEKRLALQSALEKLCGTEGPGATLRLTVVENVPLAAVPGLPPLPFAAGDAQSWPPVFLSVEPA